MRVRKEELGQRAHPEKRFKDRGKGRETPTGSEPYAMLVRKNARAVTQKIRGYKIENPRNNSKIAANFGEPIAFFGKTSEICLDKCEFAQKGLAS